MKSISKARKIFSVLLVAVLLHSFLGNVLTAQMILAISDHSHHTESSFNSDGIQVRLVHVHAESQIELDHKNASESLHSEIAAFPTESHIEEFTHSDHEIDFTIQDSNIPLDKNSGTIPDFSLFQLAQTRSQLFLPHATDFFKLPEKRNAPLHTRLRSVVILV